MGIENGPEGRQEQTPHLLLLGNSFSMNMLKSVPARLIVTELTLGEAATLAQDAISIVGHADTAAVFASVLGLEVLCCRVTVGLATGDRLVIGQYRGPRLPEGCSTLPEGATIQWLLVEVE